MTPDDLAALPPARPGGLLGACEPDVLACALAYAARGWHVIPLHGVDGGQCSCRNGACASAGKHPRVERWPEQASTEPVRIREWWSRWPSANVGILTGQRSGLVVLDLDPRNGGEKSMQELLERHGPLPETQIVQTGGGGRHFYFAHPGPGVPSWHPGEGLDLQADGGHCVVAPPSAHMSGARYAWTVGTAPGATGLAPLPHWLSIDARGPRSGVPASAAGKSDVRKLTPANRAWARRALQKECEVVATTKEGNRNNELNESAFRIGQLVPHLLDVVDATDELIAASAACGLLESDEAQVRATIASGLTAGELKPRLPESSARRSRQNASVGPSKTRRAEGRGSVRPHNTDLGNSERFAKAHSGRVRYCAAHHQWVVWNGIRWTADSDGEPERLAARVVRKLYSEIETLNDYANRAALGSHALRSEGARPLRNLLMLARTDRRIAIKPDAFDSPDACYLLNVLNGTVDLRTGTLLPHDSSRLITRLAPVHFEASATSPLWARFLARVLPDAPTRDFVRRFVGYALTGDTSEQVLLFLLGGGANGKSTFLETLSGLFGDYSMKADTETFMRGRGGRDRKGGARPDILGFAGRRLVVAAEVEHGQQLDSNLIKELTGGDTLTARGLYERHQTSFRPQCKIILASNHRPEVREASEAIWRRILEVPFDVTIPESERDPSLAARLREPKELSGVLNWALAGYRDFISTTESPRLRPPESIRYATQSYREEQDPIAAFLDACCDRRPRALTTNRRIRAAYLEWCQRADDEPISEKRLSQSLGEHGYQRVRGPGKDRTRCWRGLALMNDPEASNPVASDGLV